MDLYKTLLDGNKMWVSEKLAQDPMYFRIYPKDSILNFCGSVAQIAGYPPMK